ncbi:MAG: hypothetical protein M9926_04390 [Lentimicrobium sp.]|uniref:hypothetical protein n=1 Tax=Lentimicrobium sp. TaxID=2034841 RepID=UPI0025CD85A3|nr:hypothetical protein [Lentimicrobium sp.]MCO5255979.1 hypothetical protein [Lentimicrobium sp.]
MQTEVRIVNSRRLLSVFINLPARIHKGHKNWLPPIYHDEWLFFDPRRNKAFNYCDTILALAFSQGVAVGRIMGIIHHPYNELKGEKSARFSHFDCTDNPDAVSALLKFIENWAKEKGMNQVTGPYGFSDKDPQGFLFEGYDDIPLIDTSCNLPYMVDYTLNNGYSKLVDCLTYRFDIDFMMPDIYQRVQQRLMNTHRYTILEFKNKRALKPHIVPVLRLVNETYRNLYGFYPMEETEMHDLARRYMPVLDPRFVKIIMLDQELVGFVVGLSNMSEGIMRAKGKLFPFGWYFILQSLNNSTQLDLMLGAVKPGHQGLGLEISMGLRLLESARKAGIRTIETHLILESNQRMRAVIERINAPVVKRFRVFTKKIPGN